MKIKFRKFSSRAVEPFLATTGSACYNLSSAEELMISPRSCHCIKTDIGLSIPKGYFGYFLEGAGQKSYYDDSDYRGNIIVIFHNYSHNWFHIHESDKIAQISIQTKVSNIVFEEVKNFEDKTERGEGGFGSTNKKTCREDMVQEPSA